jgi:hypothetical protein
MRIRIQTQIRSVYFGTAALTSSIGNNSVADPDPRLGASIRIQDEQPGLHCLELRINFFTFWGVKILKFFDKDPGLRQFGSGIRDGKKSDPGSGIDIPDPPHWEISTKIQRINTGKKDAVTLLNRIRKKEYGSELKNAMGLRTHDFIPQTYAFVNTGSIREL